MEKKVMYCHNCNQEIEIAFSNFPGRHDDCLKCGADLRCCANCGFYDRSAANECKEIISEKISEKSKANYCDYFTPSSQTGNNGDIAKKKVNFDDLSKQLAESLKKLK